MPLDARQLHHVAQRAHAMADAAGEHILPLFRRPLEVDNKSAEAFDPVTEADRGAERVIRELIEKDFPDDSILGEEYGAKSGQSGYEWILDPVDGTRAFITGVPQWGTLIALHDGQQSVFGMMDQPFLQERYVGTGSQAELFLKGKPAGALKVRQCATLAEAVLMTTCPDLFFGVEKSQFAAVCQRVAMTRYGGDCYAYCMLASGFIDLIVETGLQAYDIQALIPIIEGAGGYVTDWHGDALVAGGNVVASGDERCHSAVLEQLRLSGENFV